MPCERPMSCGTQLGTRAIWDDGKGERQSSQGHSTHEEVYIPREAILGIPGGWLRCSSWRHKFGRSYTEKIFTKGRFPGMMDHSKSFEQGILYIDLTFPKGLSCTKPSMWINWSPPTRLQSSGEEPDQAGCTDRAEGIYSNGREDFRSEGRRVK